MTVDLSDVEMAALDDLIAKKDLSGPNVFRQALKLYQAVENGAASVTWFTKDHPAPASDELMEAIDMDDFNIVGKWIESGEKGSAPAGRVKGLWQSMHRVIAIAKHKGPQS